MVGCPLRAEGACGQDHGIYKKQGGSALLKKYIKNGTFLTATAQYITLGKSRTALEILRLSTELKTKQKLEKQYSHYLNQFDTEWIEKNHEPSNKIWFCWFQGIDEAPAVVQKCYQALKKNITDKEIVLITSENLYEYIKFPIHIQEKIDKGIIKGAHFSDLVRLELLTQYGGTWIDSTVYCSGNDIPEYMLNSELFMFQELKPGKDGHTTTISNWYISAYSNNKILLATKCLLYEYWKNNNEVADYYIFHMFFQIVIEKYKEEWNKVVPFNNSTPHILLLRLFEPYDSKIYKAVTQMTPFHKLSYKFTEEQIILKNTYYDKLFNNARGNAN